MRRCLGLSVGKNKKSDKNKTGAYSFFGMDQNQEKLILGEKDG